MISSELCEVLWCELDNEFSRYTSKRQTKRTDGQDYIGYKTVYRTLYEFTSITNGGLSCNLFIFTTYVLVLELHGQRL